MIGEEWFEPGVFPGLAFRVPQVLKGDLGEGEGEKVDGKSMKRRRMIIAAILLTAVAIAAGPFFLLRREPRFTREQAERIEFGMTEAEVTELLGCPPGDYTDGEGYYAHVLGGFHVADALHQNRTAWCGEVGMIDVYFNNDGVVRGKDYWQSFTTPPSLFERIIHFFGLERGDSNAKRLAPTA